TPRSRTWMRLASGRAREAVVDRDVTWPPTSTRVDVPARVVVEEDEPESLALRVSAPERALLVVTDLFWPGWSVTVDGDEREMYRVDYLLRGVPIEPGEHTVRFSSAPARVRLGAVLTGGTLLMLGWGPSCTGHGARGLRPTWRRCDDRRHACAEEAAREGSLRPPASRRKARAAFSPRIFRLLVSGSGWSSRQGIPVGHVPSGCG